MVEWVELRGGHVEGPLGGILVLEVIVEGEKIDVMHGHVVTLVSAQQEADIEERGTIKPGWKLSGQRSEYHLLYRERSMISLTPHTVEHLRDCPLLRGSKLTTAMGKWSGIVSFVRRLSLSQSVLYQRFTL